MRVFVTGASGFIGSAIVRELQAAGHHVIGLARSARSAAALRQAGVAVQAGDMNDPASLAQGTARADAVIHTAFNHDFSRFRAHCEDDRRVIDALGGALAGSERPLLVTSAIGVVKRLAGQPGTEQDPAVSATVSPRAASEEAALAWVARGVRVSIVRLPQVHDRCRQGLITFAVALARETGLSAYVGDGQQRWPAAHVNAVAKLYRLALERGQAGARYHAVAEPGVAMRDIAHAIGQRLSLRVASLAPEHAAAHFGWLAPFAGDDMPACSEQTQCWLAWDPSGPSLLDDLARLPLAPDEA